MNEKFIRVISLLRKTASQNQLYVWLLVFTLALSSFSYLHRDFFDFSKAREDLGEDLSFSKRISLEELLKNVGENILFSHLLRITFLLGFLFFIIGVYLSFYFLMELFKGKVSLFSQDFKLVSWQVSDILRAVIIILFFVNFLHVAEPLFIYIFNTHTNLFVRFVRQAFLIDIFSLIVILYFVFKKYTSQLSSLGLEFRNLWSNLLFGIAHYIGLIPPLLVSIFVSFFFAQFLEYEPQPSPIFILFLQPQPKSLLFFTIFFITFFGPLAEEIFFRGFCYPCLRKKFGPLKSALFVSGFFACLHMNIMGLLPIFLLGLLLVYLYEKTDSLISSIAVHVVHNSVILYLVFLYRYLVLR